ncbi:ABC transporter ATP-binding and permease protein [Lactococcus cremoris subsp. cremoris UC509.9]|uniref:ATP-binding cassette domain-containing protein n=1 Tax=Lactococcus lactis subsp. cremoris TaxID=1359 RepID=A0AAJ6N2C5_LACLC|nr:ABC transporter ATP-binding protein/permease [Lactococcus cremoris]AFW91311.1 ABC transporter ATP-binding and permease protein [Lactococcus cremoris subsp. cremoris UC509.9]ARD90986.1 ATP-binding cassette domain-containing protein [Lactococcus cremoris]MRM67919.1 ATP-binding cassette domain-containing protein [Lactococcus cremoris]QJD19600.1 ATP-binding cassette domain-containing protein [Lactococcus cremoris]QRZ29488.1 ABC transporter ATP-binding and permease protein [Lactococcus cremoris]
MAVLELKNIRKSYFLGKEEFPVLKGIDLEFERGDFVSLLGESGGGKSTLMNIIGGLDRKYEGDVIVDGLAQKTKKEKDMDAYRRDTIGFIFQSFNLVSYLSVLDNILISLKMTSLSDKERHERAIELTKQVGLYEHRKKNPSQLSGGQKQRVAIARALASDPEIILADEPTGALDSQNTKEVLALLRQIAQSGKTVIVVTHSQEVADYGTRIIRLADGQIIGDERLKPPYPVESHQRMQSKALSYRDTFRTAFKHFTHSWKINLLIAIGTAIGLFSVIFFLGLGNGATKYMNDTITSSVNPNVVTIFKRTTTDNKLGNEQALQQTQKELGNASTNLDSDHLSKLKKVDNVKKVEPTYSISGLGTLTNNDKSKSGLITLDTWTQSNINDDYVSGSKPADGEIAIYAKDAKELNKDYKSLVGKKITLKIPAKTAAGASVEVTKEFTVSGILKDPQGPAGSSSSVIATYNTVKSALEAANADTDATYAVVTVNKVDNVKSTTSDIQDLKIDGTKAFVTYSVTSFLDVITNITNIVTYVLAAIAGISLIVSIFMIVVTTYMSVAERTKEIGVIRALGGRKKDISRLFTAESLILGLSSAAIAIGFAYLGQFLINKVLSSFLEGASIVQISGGHIIFAIIIAVLIALLASLAPSGRAARLNTIEALASE